MEKPYSPAADRNKDVIYQVLKEYIDAGELLEVGTGTAQHAIYMAQKFPSLNWTTADQAQYHPGIKMWLDEFHLSNLKGPYELTIGKDEFPNQKFDYLYTANTLHIMSWKECELFFSHIAQNFKHPSQIFIYGPFNYQGEFTSESNALFDQNLKERDPESGIRGFEQVQAEMIKAGFKLHKDHKMPANNRLLVFKNT